MEMQFDGKQLVLARFGRWPAFHDAEVKRIVLTTPAKFGDLASLEMQLYCWDLTSELDDTGHYKVVNRSLITLLFAHLDEISLSNFNHQNAIYSLTIESLAPEKPGTVAWHVTVEESFGVELELRCQRLHVLGLLPCNEMGIPIL